MDIITNPLTPANTAAITRLDAVTGINPLNPATTTTAVDLTPLGSTTVDLSPLGQFLSSLSLSRKTLSQLQGATTAANDTSDANNANNAEAVTTAAQQLANAFNVLQTNAVQTAAVGTAQSAIDGLASDEPETPLQTQAPVQAQTQPLQTPTAGVDTASNLDTLAQLGITLQTSPVAANNNTLVVDEQTLQAAFAANPAGTVTSLNQAADALNAFGANLLQQTASAVTQANSIDGLESESAQALQQAAAVRDTFAADNENPPAPPGAAPAQNAPALDEAPTAAAVPQTTLADMALTDLLGETQQLSQTAQAAQATDAASAAQQQATTLAAVNAAQQSQAATAAEANTALLDQEAQTQAAAVQEATREATAQQASATRAAQAEQAASDAAIDQQQADAALTARQAANAVAATEQANNAATAAAQAQAALQTGNTGQANAETGVEEANRLARDPAIAAAIAAYHLNDGPLRTDMAAQELAVLSQRQLVAPVAPVTRVEPVEKA